jgi:mono/diheme cytochrome c family protein
MNSVFKVVIVVLIFGSVVSCKKNSRPNYQFMPNMYESIGYEAYQESDAFLGGIEAQIPAEGSIPRGGHMPFEIENSNDGYLFAKANLISPLDSTQIDKERGGALYDIYCGICHGSKGAGQGKLVKMEKILGVPSYADAGRAITDGSIYHTVYYGKNSMGGYLNQLNEEERWQVVDYVLTLKANLEKK